jgi:hypothetical protein
MDEKELTTPVNVGITVSAEDGVYEGAELCSIRAVSLTLTDVENATAELVVILNDNSLTNHMVKLPAHRAGLLMKTAGVNMYEELPGRLLYAADLTNTRPVLVNPFTFAAVRTEAVSVPEPALEDSHAGHDHG